MRGPRTTRQQTGTRRGRRTRRTGASYVFFLGTALLVTIIGLSALTAVRIDVRTAEGTNDAAAARLYAQSAVEHAALVVYGGSKWRDDIPHDTWQTKQRIGRGYLVWKLVDEVNGSLTLDRNAPVRLHGKGVCGASQWIYSTLVQPPVEAVGPNFISNGDLESGATTPWWAQGSCRLQVVSGGSECHGGQYALRVYNRTGFSPGPGTTLAGSLPIGSTIRVSAWVRMKIAAEDVVANLRIQTDAGTTYVECARVTAGTRWTHLAGLVTPAWEGQLIEASLEISTTTTGQDLYVDDASIRVVNVPVGPVSGTWRREPQ